VPIYRNYRIIEVQEASQEGGERAASLRYDVFQEDGLEVRTGFATEEEAKAFIDSVSM
jgi:hypothetical protein